MTQASLEKAKPGPYGILLCPGVNRLNVLVSKEAVPRSILIWDRILKGIERSGFKVRMEGEYPGRTIVTVDGEELCVRLREKVSRTKHVPTAAEMERMERFNHLFREPTWDYRPSGKLVLTIDYLNRHNQTVNQATWTDSERMRIEDRLDCVSDVLVEVAKDLKRGRVLWEERERTTQEEERRRREAGRVEAQEKKRIEQLERQASTWALVSSIRQFVQAVRKEATRRTGAIEAGSPLDQWLRWAERQATSIDPVGVLLTDISSAKEGG